MDVDAICAVFDLGAPEGPPTYVARGELGRVSRLTTTSGSWAVKEIDLFPPTVEEADANVELQESMLDVGVNLPRPRRTIDGHGLFGNVRVYEWMDLTAIANDDVGADVPVAETLALMHQHAPHTARTPDPWYCEPPDRAEWDAVVAHGAGRWWAAAVAALTAELEGMARPNHVPLQICHLDVCPENVFLSGGRLTVIDWENAAPAATVQDLGSTLWDFFQGDAGRTRSFVDHYRRHGGLIEQLDASVFDMARVVHVNLVAFHCRRDLDPAGTADTRARAAQALRSLLARPLTARVVDDMISACRT